MSGAGYTASGASPPEPPGSPPGPGHRQAAEHLRGRLLTHHPRDDRESLSLAIMVAELDRLERPFDEDGDLTHVTASAIAVGRRGVVLHRHRRLHRWMQPGGHIDPGETPEEAVLRECAEETGLEVSHPATGAQLLHVDVHRSAGEHVHLDLRYLVWAADADPAPAPGESQEVAWFDWPDAQAIADEALAGALVAARRLTGQVDDESTGAIGRRGMAEQLETLIRVQAHDTLLDQLRHRVDTLPERAELRAVEQRLAALGGELADVQARVDDLAGRQRQLEERIAAAADRRHTIEQRMRSGDVPSARDLQAMDHEVQQLGARQAQFEDEEMALLEEEEPIDAVLSEHQAAAAVLDADRERLRASIAVAEKEIVATIAAEEALRAESAAGLPGDLAERYEVLRTRLGGVGAARLVGDRCDGCHLTLPSVDVERIRNLPPEVVATCPQCDRILVH